MKEKFITFSKNYKAPTKEELKGREYCKYYDSYNHSTNSCWAFKNMVQDRINKGVLKFPEKKETILVDENPFPPVATVNITTFDLRSLINHKRRMREEMKRKRKPLYKNVWVRKSETLEKAQGSSNQEGSSRFQAFPKKYFQRNSPKFIVPPKVAPGNQWHRVQHKKFPQTLTRT